LDGFKELLVEARLPVTFFFGAVQLTESLSHRYDGLTFLLELGKIPTKPSKAMGEL